MRQFIICMLALLFVASSVDIVAKVRSRSPSRSTFRTPSKPKVRKAPAKVKKVDKKAVQPGKAKAKSSFKKPDKKKDPKAKAVSKSKMDRKQSKAMKTKNNVAAKKYGNKKKATESYRKDMATKKYTSQPATRPAHIPERVSVGGAYYPSVYYGGYYCYRDPLTMAYINLTASQMVVNQMAMQNAGYGQWQANGQPVRQSNPFSILFFFIGATIFVVVVVIVIKKFS
jgi:cation transport ATPase